MGSNTTNPFARPSDAVIEKRLREQTNLLKDEEGTTVNSIREATEKVLNLEHRFFKINPTWKAKSSEVIKDQFSKKDQEPSSPVAPTKSKPEPKPKVTKHASPDEDEGPPKAKKRKTKAAVKSESESELSDLESMSSVETKPKKSAAKPKESKQKPKRQPVKTGKKNIVESESDEPEEPTNDTADQVEEEESLDPVSTKDEGGYESEMSVLIDEEPKPKRRSKNSVGASSKSKQKASTSKSKAVDISPDEAEIKRLQGWLVKCGIRKLWGKELKPYETSKAKIKHLKQMLEDVGMSGRYSQEKANQIREARELAADIEAVKEGAERWGKNESSEEEGGEGRSKRRLVRGRKNYEFLSSDGEETD